MTQIKTYLVSIIAAATICAIVSAMTEKKTAYAMLIKLLCGIFMTITILAPWKTVNFNSIFEFTNGIRDMGHDTAQYGTETSMQAMREIIKEKTEAYILDKASSMGIDIDVEVTLNNAELPLPSSVQIVGAVSPYVKEKLSNYIATDLDIPEEKQSWN